MTNGSDRRSQNNHLDQLIAISEQQSDNITRLSNGIDSLVK